jgi:hypothetical protein
MSLEKKQGAITKGEDIDLEETILASLATKQQSVKKKRKLENEVKKIVTEMTSAERSHLAQLAFGGTGAYRGVFQNIRSFLPGRPGPECDNLTYQGKNCWRSVLYNDGRGNRKKCLAYCYAQCKEWLQQLISNVPVNIIFKVGPQGTETKETEETESVSVEWTVIGFEIFGEKKNANQELVLVQKRGTWWIMEQDYLLGLSFGPLIDVQDTLTNSWRGIVGDNAASLKFLTSLLGQPTPYETVSQKLKEMCAKQKFALTTIFISHQAPKSRSPQSVFAGFGLPSNPNVPNVYFQPKSFWEQQYNVALPDIMTFALDVSRFDDIS